jgi:RNA polymerase-binding transcription factor DksA
MASTLMPIPDRPHPDLLLGLPVLRAMLEEQRRFRLDQLAELAADPGHPVGVGAVLGSDVGGGGESASHVGASAEASTAHAARLEVAATLAAGARQALADIEAALARMRAGRYGACTQCHSQILVERLYVIPQAAYCVDCQRRLTARS